ncbi:hypothetical protein [Natrarchaeobius oligotrophus]|uniref:MBL fold metallo-hydrolase n=1 Tax=Natrarchaeobius chitinivorans TaxID=1679083 RepID=A0A3N6MZ25_NATCH|nr:hypothetical protein [Natrarchaeobius chitinivorans]RQH01762.1 hypothetical protein EA472_05420 [Natrarchaeobius chitinivorans]
MVIYDRTDAAGFEPTDRWADGFGWIAHPGERAKRASHAVRCDDGVWLVDPLWAPDVDDRIDELGTVAGVLVCFNWHARDADRFARRYDVPVSVPDWPGMDRVEARLEASVERFADRPGTGDAGLELRRCEPMPGWSEAMLYREADATLYVPESLATAPTYTVGDERLGTGVIRRVNPPRDRLADLEPERVLVGHGEGVFDEATRALEYALAVSRRRLPRAVVENGPSQVRALFAAMRS